MATLRGWPFWLFVAILVLLHFLLHLGMGLGATAPDLLTVAVLLSARRLRPAQAALLGLLLGMLQDALALLSFGAEALTQALLGLAGAHVRDFFVGESAFFVGIYLFAGKWCHDIVFLILSRTGTGGEIASRLLVQAPVAGLYAAACGLVALLCYRAATGER